MIQIEGWMVTVGVFIATQIGSLIWILANQKWESKQMQLGLEQTNATIDDMQIEIGKLGDVLIRMADMRGEINLMNERLMAQVKRFDDTIVINNARELRYEARLDELRNKINSTA